MHDFIYRDDLKPFKIVARFPKEILTKNIQNNNRTSHFEKLRTCHQLYQFVLSVFYSRNVSTWSATFLFLWHPLSNILSSLRPGRFNKTICLWAIHQLILQHRPKVRYPSEGNRIHNLEEYCCGIFIQVGTIQTPSVKSIANETQVSSARRYICCTFILKQMSLMFRNLSIRGT
jgi:hypothetical protein